MKNLRDAIRAFIDERDLEQFHSPKNLAMTLSVEVAEITEHFQWLNEKQSRNLPPEKLAKVRKKIGDVMKLLAHATISQTMDTYSHVLPDMGGRTAVAMQNALP